MVKRLAPVLVAAALSALSGCACYQHRLMEPAEFAGSIDREGISFTIDPLEYHAAEQGGRLLLRITNPTHDPITLLGERSYLIDPMGESRAMLGGVIAPGSRITMVLPPAIETVRPGPRFGVGVGVGVGGFGGRAFHDPWRRHPAYVRETFPVWRWVTGPVRMNLVYERADERFAHELELERVKVK